eukprot:scaffold2801_cov106-Skeletonema_dohrnii-CCMP3373.AAC.7
MRVLCLHPSTSSAHQLHSSLSSLEDRLWTKHGIELVFIDAPLLDVQIGDSLGEKGGGLTALHLDGEDSNEGEGAPAVSRRWYVEESVDGRRSALPPSSDDSAGSPQEVNSKNSTAVKYSGLDASLLHLSQIWSRGGANHNSNNTADGGGGIEQCLPFQGILGIHQGADVAAMLPLLNTANAVYNDDDIEEENKENKSIFEGLQFVILVDGRDIMSQDQHEENMGNDGSVNEMNKENDDATLVEEEDWYVEPNGISSLHVIAETSNNDNNASATNKRNSELLAKRYGPNATIQYYKPSKKSSSSSQSNNKNSQQQAYNHNQTTSPSLHNILGKYLVHQKNTFHSNSQKRKLLQLQHQLCHVEQLASVMITEEVRKNPPKCLMAMIGPAAATSEKENAEDENDENHKNSTDDENSAVKAVVPKTVGAWQGPGRVPGEQGGGAPCPESFLLRQEERGSNVVAPHDIILADEK